MLPSISIDDGVFKHCSSEAVADVLDQFGGIEHYSGTAVGLHLQKFWISLVESSSCLPWNGVLGSEQASALPWNSVLGSLRASSWPWNGVLGGRDTPS